MIAVTDSLITIDAQTLIETPLEKPSWIIEDFLSVGLQLLVGAPKVGKSWLVLSLLLAVSTGAPFWGFATTRCDVLYLCLEDTLQRLQDRLFKLTNEASTGFHLCIQAGKLASGLIEQLEKHLGDYPNTKLIVIDTFQVIRQPTRDNAYASDYNEVGLLKNFADSHAIAILLIHHTRKMGDSDVFNTVSGTTGLTGAADTTMVLNKEMRCDDNAKLTISGRDVEFQEYKLRFNSCRWELIEKTSTEELAEREVAPCVVTVLDFMATRACDWMGTATELKTTINCEESPNVLSKHLNEHKEFLAERGIKYERGAKHEGRLLRLRKVNLSDGGNDGDD